MRCIVLVALLVCVGAVLADEALFDSWASQNGKTYTTAERANRYATFMSNKARIDAQNANSPHAQFGLNFFSDLSEQEFKQRYLMNNVPRVPTQQARTEESKRVTPPATWDWRTSRTTSAVTAVKDQKQCGACWAFSAIEAIESAYILAGRATSTSISLSAQQLLDCDTVDNACNGGNPINAYNYIKTPGIDTAASYNYTAVKGTCKYNSATVGARVTGYKSATTRADENTLKNNLVNMGPLSVCLDASQWQNYKGSVMTQAQCCPSGTCSFNHCVQLVGYNTAANPPYWILRNQWNTYWGDKGYIYLAMGTDTCALTIQATWPTV